MQPLKNLEYFKSDGIHCDYYPKVNDIYGGEQVCRLSIVSNFLRILIILRQLF